MSIMVTLDMILVKRKIRAKDLANQINISEQNLSLLKNGKMKGIRFSTLGKICRALNCQPADILYYNN